MHYTRKEREKGETEGEAEREGEREKEERDFLMDSFVWGIGIIQ